MALMPLDPDLQTRIDAARAGLSVVVDTSELGILKRKLAAREGKPGFKDNCAELRARIAELEG
jgi:hypothetical protein